VWIVYLIADKTPLAWAAFIVLLPVALLGFTMFARWIGVYRGGGYVEPHQVGGAAAQPGQSGHRRSERVNDGAARCVMGSVVCTPAAVR
jgi:hypothetical protein